MRFQFYLGYLLIHVTFLGGLQAADTRSVYVTSDALSLNAASLTVRSEGRVKMHHGDVTISGDALDYSYQSEVVYMEKMVQLEKRGKKPKIPNANLSPEKVVEMVAREKWR